MKHVILLFAAVLALTAPLSANPSAHFSTVPGTVFAWRLDRSEDNWLLSFPRNSSQIDSSSPADAALFADYVNLPTMTITDLEDHGTYLTATLIPTEPFAIISNPGEDAVLTASMTPRSALFEGANFVAFSNIADDLDVLDSVPAYSPVVDRMVAGDAEGIPFDISFSGDAAGGLDLVETLRAAHGLNLLSGTTLSGQIFVIPAPGALILAGIGAMAMSILRRRTML